MPDIKIQKIAGGIMELVYLIKNKLSRPFDHKAKHIISPMQFFAIFILNTHGSLTTKDLAVFLSMSKQQLTPIVNKLSSQGLIERHSDPNDKRKIKLGITAAGLELIQNHKKQMLELTSQSLNSLSTKDLVRLERAIQDINEVLGRV